MTAGTSPSSDVKVSVSMVTYNHERFIAQAIASVLMQRTNFAVELVIGEDCSTDGTREIVAGYAQRYPGRIRALLHEHNLGRRGLNNVVAVLKACRGRYVALCEGDDYWTDPLKLQKQVDFLEAHPDYVLCHHDACIVDAAGQLIRPSKLPDAWKHDSSGEELIQGAWILTLTACFRNVVREFPPELLKAPITDTFMWSLLGSFGKAKYMGATIRPAAYRAHAGGVWSPIRNEWQGLFHTLATRYWLRKYYWRLGQREHAQSFALQMPHAPAMYQLRCADEVEASLDDDLRRLDSCLEALHTTDDEVAAMRACLSANLHMGAALACFALGGPEPGGGYLRRAIELDAEAWGSRESLEKVLAEQALALAESQGSFDLAPLHRCIEGFRHHMPQGLRLPRAARRRATGTACARAAYRCYLAGDAQGLRRFTRMAWRRDPGLVTCVGMWRRAVRG